MARAYSRRRTRSRRQRGAVLVEGLVVGTLLIVFLAGVLFAHRLYSAKFATMQRARMDAWDRALPGCGGADLAPGLAHLGTLFDNVSSSDLNDEDVSDWLVTAERGVDSQGPLNVEGPHGSGASFSVDTRTSVACNEVGDQRPRDSNLGTMWSYIGDML